MNTPSSSKEPAGFTLNSPTPKALYDYTNEQQYPLCPSWGIIMLALKKLTREDNTVWEMTNRGVLIQHTKVALCMTYKSFSEEESIMSSVAYAVDDYIRQLPPKEVVGLQEETTANNHWES